MSARPKEGYTLSWRDLWADLLKGAGTGLLKYDGSRAAQAALAGLEVFDAAQERRRQSAPLDPVGGHEGTLSELWSTMSPEEQAAFQRLPGEEQDAYLEEWAEEANDGASHAHVFPSSRENRAPVAPRPLPYAGRPISINPLDGLRLQSILPFGPDGSLNLPTYRR